jgi:inactivated superfamily I helicase
MTLEEAIKHCEEVYERKIKDAERHYDAESFEESKECIWCAEEHRQLAEWLKELEVYREFADWLVKAILSEDWEESADFYAEVLCRKLTKLGKLKVVDNKYMEVRNEDSD